MTRTTTTTGITDRSNGIDVAVERGVDPVQTFLTAGAGGGYNRRMQIFLNGVRHECEPGSSVADVLDQAGFADRRIAVEINRAIVPRSQLGARELKADDRIEIVHAIGGG